MKRFWILPIAVFVMFFAVSCGSESNSEEKNSDPTDTETTDEEKNDEEVTDAEVTDTEITDTEVTDDDVPTQCEDSEGRIYNKGDSISHECRAAYCCDYGDWCEEEMECDGCVVGDNKKWMCADGVTEVDWCECVEDEESGSKWNCVERADLTCGEPKQCKDSEGRKYNEGDKIPDECLIATCMEGSWTKDAVECSPCGTEIGTKMEWTCADGVTKVDWCECVEDEESGSKWNCVERADLNCPNE